MGPRSGVTTIPAGTLATVDLGPAAPEYLVPFFSLGGSSFEGPSTYIELGIRDLAGIAYWLDKMR